MLLFATLFQERLAERLVDWRCRIQKLAECKNMKKNNVNLGAIFSGCLIAILLTACNAANQRGVVVVKNSSQQDQQVNVAQNVSEPVMSVSDVSSPEIASESTGDQVESKYMVRVGDVLEIFVWRNPELSVTVPVRPDGFISIPLVDDLKVVGVTTTAISRQIEALLQSYIKFPKVTVMVTSFGSAYTQQVRVIGQAAQPRALPYKKDMTLLDMLIEVGGLTEFAAGNRAVLIRDTDGQQQKYPLKLEDLIEKGDISKNMILKAGDIVIIPESFF